MPMLASNSAATANTVSNIIENRRGATDCETMSSIVRTLNTAWSLFKAAIWARTAAVTLVGSTSVRTSKLIRRAVREQRSQRGLYLKKRGARQYRNEYG